MSGKNKHIYAACVSPHSACEQIIKTTNCICQEENSKLHVITVIGKKSIEPEVVSFIDFLDDLSAECSAQLNVLFSPCPVIALAKHIIESGITHIVIGNPMESTGFGIDLKRLLEKVSPRKIHVIELPTLEQQSVSYIDTLRAAQLSKLYSRSMAVTK